MSEHRISTSIFAGGYGSDDQFAVFENQWECQTHTLSLYVYLSLTLSTRTTGPNIPMACYDRRRF